MARGFDRAQASPSTKLRLTGDSVLTITVAVSGGVLVATWPEQMLTIVLAVVAISAVMLLRHRLSPSLLSPVYIATIGYVLLAVLGGALYQRVAESDIPGASIRIRLSGIDAQNTTRMILVVAAALAAGAVLFTILFPTRPQPRPRLAAISLSNWMQTLLLVAVAALLAITVASYGWQELLRRSSYLQEVTHRPIHTIATSLGMAAVLGLGYLFAAGSGRQRLLVLLLLAAYCLVLFATGSRRLAMLPLLFTVGGLGSAPQSRRWMSALFVAAALSLTLIRLSLYTRSLSEHGFWPYLDALPDVARAPGWDSAVLNLLVGFGVIGKTAFGMPHIPAQDLLISVNPLPGDASGWYGIAEEHRLNLFTPFAALGELRNAGWSALIGYGLAAGFVLAYLDYRMRTLLARGQQLYGLALVGLAELFIVLSTQYNLRSATRLLYYALVLDMLIRLWLTTTVRRDRAHT